MVSVLYTRRVLRLATEEADAALMRNGNNGPPP